MRVKKPTTVLTAVIAALLVACEEDPCSLTTQSVARFDFRDSRTHQGVTLTQGATVEGIATIADTLNVDTVFNQAKNYMSVPLSFTDKTTYVIHYTELMRDTIRLTHKNIPYVSNIECGAVMHNLIEGLSFTTNALDSVTITNPLITNEETTNFYIYFRTDDDV